MAEPDAGHEDGVHPASRGDVVVTRYQAHRFPATLRAPDRQPVTVWASRIHAALTAVVFVLCLVVIGYAFLVQGAS